MDNVYQRLKQTPEQLFLLAGPCVIESESHALKMAAAINDIAQRLNIPYVFKASYDKANRTSGAAFRGLGLDEGLRILQKIKREIGVPVLTDVHESAQVPAVAEVADILQIPAFLCRQTDLLSAAANSGRIVNVKKGQFLSPWEMKNIVEKLEAHNCREIMLTERGSSFGYNNLVVDMRGLPVMRGFGYPVVYDATHSLQLPGGAGAATGGLREYIPHLARAAVACGVDGLFMEVHDQPERALSDAATQFPLDKLQPLLEKLLKLHALARS
ncbi:MAG: 3-deoxy-8-phosphooctulonate synthase [Acidobacteria bacterium]|nr:3-deoxy-8-phosphooctulonate synthase [Acidobacteriota bacterium]MBI3424509.1 3-deoxy-8-phosphooctulonate synthase [Acidobacteriota bacterium]